MLVVSCPATMKVGISVEYVIEFKWMLSNDEEHTRKNVAVAKPMIGWDICRHVRFDE